jgi:hypothetical protein
MYNSGTIVRRLNEGSKVAKTVAKPSQMTFARVAAVNQIKDMATASGVSLNEAVTRILTNPKSQEALRYYMLSKYETPFTNPVKLAVQCILQRFADVATIAKALSISEAEALVEIENGEFQALTTNMADGGIMPPDVQAALSIGVEELMHAAASKGLSPSAPGLLTQIKLITGDNFDNSLSSLLNVNNPENPNNADGATINLSDFRPDAGTVDTSGVYSGGTSTSTSSGGGWSWDSIFGTINQAIDTVKNATEAVGGITGQIKDTSGTINDVLNDVGGGIGGSAINQSSLPWIIGGGFLLLIVVIVIIYANKRK